MSAFISSTPLSYNRHQTNLSSSICNYHPVNAAAAKQSAHNPNHRSLTPSMVAVRGSSDNPYRIAVLPGDGAGPAAANAVKKILGALAADADLHFQFIDAPYGEEALKTKGSLVPDETVEICKSADAVLRSHQGLSRGPSSTSAHLQLLKRLEIFAQFRPVIVYPQLLKLSTLREDVIKNMDIMLVRELSAGAITFENSSLGESNQSIIEYTNGQIENIADMAIQIAEKRSGKILNIDKSDVMSVSKLWRRVLNDRINNYKSSVNDGIFLNNMYIDDFVREVIYKPNDFDVVVTSNLFGDICAEVIDAIVGPQRISPSFWKGKNDLGVYGPADVYNLEAYPSNNSKDIGVGPNAIAITRAASMMLRYELDEPAAANTIQQALRKTMADFADDISKNTNDEQLLISNNAVNMVSGTTNTSNKAVGGGLNGNGANGSSVLNGSEQSNAMGQAKELVSAFSKTSADEYADVVIRSMQLLKQFEQVCDPTECGE